MNIEELIVKNYHVNDGVWVVEQGKMVEANMLRKAVERIEDLKERLEDAEASVADWEDHFDEEVAETIEVYNGKIADFSTRFVELKRQVEKIKHVANNTIAVSDEFLKEGNDEQ